jgi:hypothetical protein
LTTGHLADIKSNCSRIHTLPIFDKIEIGPHAKIFICSFAIVQCVSEALIMTDSPFLQLIPFSWQRSSLAPISCSRWRKSLTESQTFANCLRQYSSLITEGHFW